MSDSNSRDEILDEIRSIRALLMIDRKQDLIELGNEIDDVQYAILDKLSYDKWIQSSDIKNELVEELDISGSNYKKKIRQLGRLGLVEKEGIKRWTKYRKTGLLRMVETISEE